MTVKYFDSLPKPYKAYAKAVIGMIQKGKKPKTLPEAEYVVSTLQIDKTHLASYNEVCGFTQKGILPPTYLAVLSQALQMTMMTEEPFPFALMGLVHVRNSVKQYRAIKEGEVLSMSLVCVNLRPHEKGNQFDFVTIVKSGSQIVWEGVTTYLARGKPMGDAPKADNKARPTFEATDLQTLWTVKQEVARRYAKVSGDINPIHLHPLTAKALGFPTMIAHGMWTKARCLAEMGTLPDAYECDVSFKLPVFLPAKLEFKAQTGKNIAFELNESGSGKPHIAGTFKAL